MIHLNLFLKNIITLNIIIGVYLHDYKDLLRVFVNYMDKNIKKNLKWILKKQNNLKNSYQN